MDALPLETLARWSAGDLLSGDPAAPATGVCIDSRALKAGDLFVAIRGEKFDGHNFLPDAVRLGAAGAVVEHAPEGLPAEFGLIRVPDNLRALQQIAHEYRRTLSMQVVAITGSNGKTSTKDLTACVLAEGFQVSKTEGNFNNHLGLPLTILRAQHRHQIGVFEIGMNHPGEIAPLAAIAQPDVAIITNIGVAHIEYMGSREAIAQEKGMLAESLKPSGYVILSAEDDFSTRIAARTKADAIFAGIEQGDVQARDVRPHFNGTRFTIHADGQSVEAELPIAGAHMVRNAMLAVAAGRAFGISLAQCAEGLRKIQLTKGRLEQKIVRGIQILDDTYNANPDSMAAAIQTLSEMPVAGRRIAVLGRMGELGIESENGHKRVGEDAVRAGLDCVIGVGQEAKWITDTAWRGGVEKVLHFSEIEDALKALREFAHPGDIVLVKGSRSARMERIVEGLQAA